MKKLILIILLALQSCSTIYRVDIDKIRELKVRATGELKKLIEQGLPFRPDGFCYSIDLAEIMHMAVEIDDSIIFRRAYEIIKRNYIIRDSWIDSSILWRYKPGSEIEASGTAETIHCAYAIFLAYKKWKVKEYKQVSYSLAKAYFKHGYMIDSNKFLVKNYFNYQTRALSENTWIINQRPDFLMAIGIENNDAQMIEKAHFMYNAVMQSYVKNGFFHSIYDIGIRTVIPSSNGYYSPNGIFPLISSIDIGISIFQFNSKPSQQIFKFIHDNFGEWSDYYVLVNGDFKGLGSGDFALSIHSKLIDLYFLLGKPSRYKMLIQYIVGDVLPEKIETILKLGPQKVSSFYFELAVALRTLQKLSEDAI
ncbi:MAG: hypothetical protein RMJ81_08750 [Candidatus Kryptonium sp.]|nr:hypothetical protein [Candidatus Kryptonium sp.]MCX7762952.1 hypothetical protein [Candidatus Kryptonium sp.]MDW8109727.1 hypothetical protein [Candidatus Kryptonium sp.]